LPDAERCDLTRVQAGAERNWSTVGLYHYRRTTVKFRVVRAF
jgi:hypothetical protein